MTARYPGIGWGTDHPTVEVKFSDGGSIPIDEERAPLMAAIWDRGVRTYTSCQDCEGRVLIGFASATDAEKFVQALGLEGPDGHFSQYDDEGSLFCRVAGLPSDEAWLEGEEERPDLWHWIIWFTPRE